MIIETVNNKFKIDKVVYNIAIYYDVKHTEEVVEYLKEHQNEMGKVHLKTDFNVVYFVNDDDSLMFATKFS